MDLAQLQEHLEEDLADSEDEAPVFLDLTALKTDKPAEVPHLTYCMSCSGDNYDTHPTFKDILGDTHVMIIYPPPPPGNTATYCMVLYLRDMLYI